MSTLIYAPGVVCRIYSSKLGKVVDVSDDVAGGSLARTLGPSLSVMNLTLTNDGRKYSDIFSPQDRFVLYMRRFRTLLVMSGYLNMAPMVSVVPKSVRLRGACTLKRLQNFYWDPGTQQAVSLYNSQLGNDGGVYNDGGLAFRTIDLLTEVAGWSREQIHLGSIPMKWFKDLQPLKDQILADAAAAQAGFNVGSGSVIGGQSTEIGSSTSIESDIPGTGTLPATHGKISYFAGAGTSDATGQMALTGEQGTNPTDPWYCAMRWPYVNPDGSSISGVDVTKAKGWWVNRHILVTSPKTGKSVVLRAADWGPNISTGRVIDVSKTAITALGISTDDEVKIAFAQADAPLGPVKAGQNVAVTTTSQNGTAGLPTPVTSGWGNPGDASNMVQVTVEGLTFTVNKIAASRFTGFVTDLVEVLGYKPTVIGGYNPRKIAGSSSWSNHAYGAAIDIDPDKNPRYSSGAGGPYALPGPPAIVEYARKWGLKWGGEYTDSKDYMHFEVLGAPSTGSYDTTVQAATGGTSAAGEHWVTPVTKPYTLGPRFGDDGSHWDHGHSGTDFQTEAGRSIRPVGPGVVFAKGTGDPNYGNHITVDHGKKVYTFYAHMESESTLAIGSQVDTISTLGFVGQTGNATGPHVHLELRLDADTSAAALASGGIEKYVLGGAPPPRGVTGVASDTVYEDGTGVDSGSLDNIGGGILNVAEWRSHIGDGLSKLLTDYRAVMNDQPILQTIDEYMTTGFRDYCSAPNGDFIGWFPDYFGHHGQAAKMVVSPLEISLENPFSIYWSDDNLKTHQFAIGATSGLSDDSSSTERMVSTAGIASLDFPEILSALINIPKADAVQMAADYLSRFGARPEVTMLRQVSSPDAEFYFACMSFMQNWSAQYQTNVEITFMPEVFPGMLLCFPVYGVQGYVREVTHTFDFSGGGFSTTVSAAPWSTIGNSGPKGLPRGASL